VAHVKKSQTVETATDEGVRLVVVGGESTRAEVLHARLAPVVNRLLWTFLGTDPDRDDIAHDIFIKIIRGAERVRDPARLEGWAATVAMNSIRNEFRRRKLRRFLAFDPTDDTDAPSHHPDFEGRELLLRTQRLLEALPTDERIPLTLRLMDQARAEEIARVCGYSVRSAKRRLQAAKARFARRAERDPLVKARLTAGGTMDSDTMDSDTTDSNHA
jgi:RNA polymerase sigma factor (sigma-70 family)